MASNNGSSGGVDVTERRARARARSRVAELQGFYAHVAVYIAVNVLLFAIDLIAGDGLQWAYWPALGWGIGLVAHAVVTFRSVPAVGADWRERKIEELTEEELERERSRGRR